MIIYDNDNNDCHIKMLQHVLNKITNCIFRPKESFTQWTNVVMVLIFVAMQSSIVHFEFPYHNLFWLWQLNNF
jgi:hypothetical protein